LKIRLLQIIGSEEKNRRFLFVWGLLFWSTAHFEYVHQLAAIGFAQVAQKYSVPVIFGVLPPIQLNKQLKEGSKAGNKGWDAH